MNFTVGRPKLRAQIAASCRNAYLSIAFAPQALPNADKNGVSSPPRWIRSNKNPFRQNRHLCNAQVQSLLYQAVCRKMTKNVKVLLDSFLVDKKSPLSPLQKFDSINRSDLWLYDYVYIIAHVYIIYICIYVWYSCRLSKGNHHLFVITINCSSPAQIRLRPGLLPKFL